LEKGGVGLPYVDLEPDVVVDKPWRERKINCEEIDYSDSD